MTLLQAGYNQFGFDEEIRETGLNRHSYKSVFIAESPVMKRLYEQIKLLAEGDSSVLILGVKGTGREKTAYEIFQNRKHKTQKSFIKFVCYGFDQNYIEKKLFGEQGLLYKGSDVTLFIKGIECFGITLQNQFLSFLLNPLHKKTIPRLICSSTENFPEEVKEGRFSRNLFEVLSQQLLLLPSLSERVEDIPFLISYFNNKNAFTGNLDDEALHLLMSQPWSGNIRELREVCFQMTVLYEGKEIITEEDLRMIVENDFSLLKNICYEPKITLEKLINHYIQLSLDHFQSKKQCAQALGISVKTIYNKIQKGDIVFSD